jgi:hypothetical protein
MNPLLRGLGPAERANHINRLQKASPGAAQNSPLLNLPPELRNRIYELVLVSDDQIEADFSAIVCSRYPLNVKGLLEEPALLRSCSEIRTQAT